MELLILSKLQWDLTAITAYDYMDHLLENLQTYAREQDVQHLQLQHLEAQPSTSKDVDVSMDIFFETTMNSLHDFIFTAGPSSV